MPPVGITRREVLKLGCAAGLVPGLAPASRPEDPPTAAYAAFEEKERGVLAPGMLADRVVLSRDILDDAERDRITGTEVMLTVASGKVVH